MRAQDAPSGPAAGRTDGEEKSVTTICVDARGGDERPEVVLEGIAAALAADPELEVLVAGDEGVVGPFTESH